MPGNRAQNGTLPHRLQAASTHQNNPIPDRQPKLLDCSLSIRKQSTSHFLIDNFRQVSSPGSECRSSASFASFASPASRISNRHTPRLGMPVSHRKQRVAPISNRHKFIFCNSASLHAQSRQKGGICLSSSPVTCHSPQPLHPSILPVDPAAPNSRDYRLAISRLLHHRGIRP